jgi:CDP-diacylglycerol--serine O-phosphatidyltransferase
MISAALASAARRLRGHQRSATDLRALAGIPVAAERVLTIAGADEFRTTLLQLIGQARERILIAALYLQDDEAGREVLGALYAARAASPGLQIAVFVDWHRAQRGLVGEASSAGNAALYVALASRLGPGVPIYGVPVHTREWMGVMHLKGFIIDDSVLYSGASLNDVYLYRGDRYRLDRYHLIESRPLADSMAALLTRLLKENAAVSAVDRETRPRTRSLARAIGQFRRWLVHRRYLTFSGRIGAGQVAITPLLGFGTRDNLLNATILHVIQHARRHLVLFTPYFNLPGAVRSAIGEKLRQGCRMTIVVGDKTANDFYLAPEQPFTTIGALPYLYEANLRRFCQAHQQDIDQDLLELYLWRHDKHTFHLKGLLADEDYALLTGSNLNPRAWRLDLENGLLIDDPQGCLRDQHAAELERILRHARRLDHHSALDAVDSYPVPVQRILKRLTRTRTDRLLNQVL